MPDLDEMERKTRLEEEILGRRTQKEALQEAQRKSGALKLGDTEAQLKRVSEEVTIEAAYRKRNIKPG
ncbi:hypothetical protein KDK_61100 [Dictyobacter kobayashii]|uniref:Uncharacterized protein n=2 Tax=Dictyobacter kobayashii TaxID=2014872 RepID=A0A402AT50_9CHLR|nr:hypothetical protein KDK_61100 [Dictyobacter kobayashii]